MKGPIDLYGVVDIPKIAKVPGVEEAAEGARKVKGDASLNGVQGWDPFSSGTGSCLLDAAEDLG